jgi:integrase
MSVRKRTWTTRQGEAKEAWVVDYFDQEGDRHIATFARKRDADEHSAKVRVDVRAGMHTAPSKSVTVAEASESWIKRVAAEGRERGTLGAIRAARAAPHRASPWHVQAGASDACQGRIVPR